MQETWKESALLERVADHCMRTCPKHQKYIATLPCNERPKLASPFLSGKKIFHKMDNRIILKSSHKDGLCKKSSYICHGDTWFTDMYLVSIPARWCSRQVENGNIHCRMKETVLKLRDKRIGKEAMKKTQVWNQLSKSWIYESCFCNDELKRDAYLFKK